MSKKKFKLSIPALNLSDLEILLEEISIVPVPDPEPDPDPDPEPDPDPIPDPVVVPERDSPTGRNPSALWSRKQQGVLMKMKEENHPYIARILQLADTADCDIYFYPIAYQLTADKKYAEMYWKRISFEPKAGDFHGFTIKRRFDGVAAVGTYQDTMRQHFMKWIIGYDWCYDAFTEEQRQQFRDGIFASCEYAVAKLGLRTGDSDWGTTGYLALAATDCLFGTKYLERITINHNKPMPVGALVPTAANTENARNAIKWRFDSMAPSGGSYIESTDYNWNTINLCIVGKEIIRSLTGVEYFPEIERFRKEVPLYELMTMPPDMSDVWIWGDATYARHNYLYRRPQLWVACGAMDLFLKMEKLQTEAKWMSEMKMWATMFFFFNPYEPVVPVEPVAHHQAQRMGIQLSRTATDLFVTHTPVGLGDDHAVPCFGDFSYYKNNELVIDRCRGYNSIQRSHNAHLVKGFHAFTDKVLTKFWNGPGWAASHGQTGGKLPVSKGTYLGQHIPAYCTNKTRTIVWLEAGIIVIRDTANALDPAKQPKYADYYVDELKILKDAKALHEGIFHAWNQPALHTPLMHTLSWVTNKGTPVFLRQIAGNSTTYTIVDENEKKADGTYVHKIGVYLPDSERKWHVSYRCDEEGPVEFVYVMSVGSEIPFIKTELVNEIRTVEVAGKTITFSNSPVGQEVSVL